MLLVHRDVIQRELTSCFPSVSEVCAGVLTLSPLRAVTLGTLLALPARSSTAVGRPPGDQRITESGGLEMTSEVI